MHILAVTILGAAIAILIRKKQSWLRNIVMLALFFFFLSEFLAILNLSLATIENVALCTLANAIYICTIPLFGFIYFREQGIEKRKAEESLAAYREHLEELVKARTNELVKANKKAIILEERQRIAAEMHDGLAQTLSYLGMKIDSASEELQNGRTTPVIHQFDQMQHAIGQAIHDVRRSITSLQETPQSPQSLQEIIEQLTNERTETTQPPIQLIDLLPKPYFLSPSEREQIRPLIGEALTNACRHSQASQITVQVSSENDNLQIIVTDNGQGFSPENQAATTSNHFGLSIMQARAARIDGNLTINSQPGRGTEITLNWHPNKKMRPVKLQEVAK
jgi:signal transduction histidine kinase